MSLFTTQTSYYHVGEKSYKNESTNFHRFPKHALKSDFCESMMIIIIINIGLHSWEWRKQLILSTRKFEMQTSSSITLMLVGGIWGPFAVEKLMKTLESRERKYLDYSKITLFLSLPKENEKMDFSVHSVCSNTTLDSLTPPPQRTPVWVSCQCGLTELLGLIFMELGHLKGGNKSG